ncbi:RHS repeat-associated core domain-containing protein [Paenibacillus xylanexedens]|uniref:RHS repeat-associated core domain-containing protein n=1 Tax=Paenibacillus xylanexedens TaxID=528191 RepID=UPI003CFC1BC0
MELQDRQVSGEAGLQTYWKNGHGDVTELKNAAGDTLNHYTYDVWGNSRVIEEQTPNVLRYAGEYWDEETGLQYLRSRWYDPNLGRFINEDTYEGDKTEPNSLNLYTYVENNPLIYVDSSGESKRGEKNTSTNNIYSPCNNVLSSHHVVYLQKSLFAPLHFRYFNA